MIKIVITAALLSAIALAAIVPCRAEAAGKPGRESNTKSKFERYLDQVNHPPAISLRRPAIVWPAPPCPGKWVPSISGRLVGTVPGVVNKPSPRPVPKPREWSV
jgi:hypothetical protein